MVLGGEVKGQASTVYATYTGPPPANTGGNSGLGGAGGLGGTTGADGSFSITGQSNINDSDLNNFATLAPISGQGGGLLGAPGGTSSAYINLNFSGAIAPKTGTSIIIKLTAGTLSGVQVQAYNGVTALGSPQAFSSLPIKGTSEYVFITPADCNTIRITSTTSPGAILGGISTNSTNIYYAYILDPNCNPPVYTATRKTTILDLGSAISNEANAIDGNLNTFSLFSNGLGVGTTLYQTVYFSQPVPTSNVVTLTFSIPPAAISAGVLGYININTYNGATLVSNTSISGLLLGTDLLTLLNAGGKTTISIAPPSAFDRVELSASSLLSLATSINLYEIQITPPKPTFPIPTIPPAVQTITICSGTKATITAVNPGSGNELRWYDAPVAGTLQFTGNPFITAQLTSNTTYYVASAKTGCAAESERIPVNVIINNITPGSININQSAICSGTAPPTFTSVAGTGTAITYQWQRSSGNNTSYNDISNATSDIYTETLNLTQTTYYRRIAKSVLNGITCTSNSNEITVTIKPIASLTSNLTATICNNGLFNYIATTNIATTSISWLRDFVPGINKIAGSGTSNIINETLSNTTSAPIDVPYIFTIVSDGCTSKQTVILKVYPSLTLSSTVAPPAICSNTSFSYTPTSAVVGAILKWTRPANPNISNPAITTAVEGNIYENLINTSSSPVVVTYNYTISINGCSTTQGVVVTVNPSPSISINPLNICEKTSSISLPYSNPSDGLISYSITWNSAANGFGFINKTDEILSPNSINIDIPNNAPTGVYKADITVKSDSDCISDNIKFTLNIVAKPGSPHLTLTIN
jgi:hypothetical protein